MLDSSLQMLVSQSIKTLDSILINETLPASERATIAFKILEMAQTLTLTSLVSSDVSVSSAPTPSLSLPASKII